MLIFDYTYLYFKVFQRTYFCRFYKILLKLKRPSFNPQNFRPGLLPVDESEVGWPGGRPMCTKRAQPVWLNGRSTGRSTAMAPVDRPVDRPESFALWIWPRSTGQSTGRSKPRHGRLLGRPAGCNGKKFDRWPVDPPVDRQQTFLLSLPPTASFWSLFIWGCFGLF